MKIYLQQNHDDQMIQLAQQQIFSNPDAVEEESLPFKDKFPVASPI